MMTTELHENASDHFVGINKMVKLAKPVTRKIRITVEQGPARGSA
jgi:hypothetical protein